MNTVIYPAEYIHNEKGGIVNTVMSALDKNGKPMVIYMTKDPKVPFALHQEEFLEEFSNALNGKKIETPENEVHRDDDFDVFKSFQENAKKEIGAIKLDE